MIQFNDVTSSFAPQARMISATTVDINYNIRQIIHKDEMSEQEIPMWQFDTTRYTVEEYLTLQSGQLETAVVEIAGELDLSLQEGSPEAMDLEQLREYKLREVNRATKQAIEAGITIETSEGAEHFSLTKEDQINIQNLTLQIQGGQPFGLYHANGTPCRRFSPEEVMNLATAATAHKTTCLTYNNLLRQYVKRVTDKDEMLSIHYGSELPADLAATMQQLLGG